MGKKKRGGGRYRGRQSGQNRMGGGRSGRGGGGGGGGRRRSGGVATNRQERQGIDHPENGDPLPLIPGSGVLEMHPNGYGFLRNPATNFTRERTDPFVPGTMIEKYGLREGLLIHGMVQRHRRGQGPRLKEVLD